MNKKKCPSCGNTIKADARFCPQCGAALTEQPDVQSKQPADRRRSSFARYIVIGSFIVIIAILLVILIQFITLEEHNVIARQPVVTEPVEYGDREIPMIDIDFRIEDGHVIFSLDDVLNHRIVFIDYQGPTSPIPVMAYISSKGKLVTAISLNEPCNATRFRIAGNDIKAETCRAVWDMNSMEAHICCPNNYPDPIPSEVTGEEVRISERTILSWNRRL
jgi:predicted nucleic acid-binding Zn ribbon protein